ncbi:MAG TPA: DNA mismatch repair endonuclease MutL [Verrucomicrobia bacterium]|nr:DNA mismatch repair endonuclease MutL [Verrucomicrobiota bacterium]
MQVANKIAAGEVVERPASVVKELMENAIDADAMQIDVAVAVAGRKLISVCDNGCGMSRDDALLSIERHATSKIRDVDDIEKIHTLGFRGEAMAAIASVSRLRLTTALHDAEAGTELTVIGGVLQDVRDGGFPPGTRIEIRDLFFNVPARRKFLRTEQTELFHIRDVFMVQALSHPSIGMSLTVDGRDLYRLAGSGTLTDRLRDLFSVELVRQLKPVQCEQRGVRIHGFISPPTTHRADRNEQYVFVNGRPTSPSLLSYAIGEGYRGALAKGRYPSVFLFIDMKPEWVDVNVHPTKKEIRFRHPGDVRDVAIAAIQASLAITPVCEDPPVSVERPMPSALPPTEAVLKIDDLPPSRTFAYPRRLPPFDAPAGGFPVDEVFASRSVDPIAATGAPPAPPMPAPIPAAPMAASGKGSAAGDVTPRAPWAWCRVLGQIAGFYVVLETEGGMVLMDPRAAHERILFDRLMGAVLARKVESQTLLIPDTVELPARDAARVRQHVALFQHLGFGISEFGGNAFVVDAVPSCFDSVPVKTLISDMAGSLELAGTRGGQEAREDALVQSACRAAVGCRQRLSLGEIEQLVVDLAQCEMPYTSPRGRPTLIFTSLKELHRKFGREGQ